MNMRLLTRRVPLLLLLALALLGALLAEAKLREVSSLNLNDRTAQWVSASAFGQVYSFLSADDLWWGSVAGTSIGLSGVKLQGADYKQGLTVVQGFGFDPTTGRMVVELYDYTPGYLNMKVYDLKSGNWANSSIAMSGQYQRLIPNSPFLDRMQQFFLIAIDNIVMVDLASFSAVANIDLSQHFKSRFPVSRITHATYHNGFLFVVRSDGKGNDEIVKLQVGVKSLKYISVVYPQAQVYNLFGWDNYILWSHVRERTGIVHGWNLQTNATDQRAAIFLGSQQWGAAVVTNSATNQSLLVSGAPSSPGYRAWVLEHHGDFSVFVDLLSVPLDTLPELAMPLLTEPSVLSVMLASHNSTGFGKVTLLRNA